MNFDLKDKVALVTGGSTGIGSYVVKILLEEGVKHVAFLDVLEIEGTEHQNKLIEKYGDKVKFYKCDVTEDEQLFGVFEAVLDKYGYIDIVINNAAIANDGPDLYRKEILINLTALTTSTFKAIEIMRKDKGGRGGVVLNVSSVAALAQNLVLSVYAATKSAVLQFSNCIGLPQYCSRTGVRVIAICFGITDSSMMYRKDVTNYDATLNSDLTTLVASLHPQKPESAARGAVEALKRGESGSTWWSNGDKPVKDITDYIQRSYQIFNELF